MNDPRHAPGADLGAWVTALLERLGVDPASVDVDRLLELSSDVAHTVARPAVPVSMFAAGVAAGLRAASADAVAASEQALADVEAALEAWEADDEAAGHA